MQVVKKAISCSFNKPSNIIFGLKRTLSFQPESPIIASKESNYTVNEIKINIPSIDGHLSGKLWQGLKPTKTPILCMHGVQDNCGSFDPLLPLIMEPDLQFFALDMPGHGLSSHTKELYYYFFLDGMGSIKRVMNHFCWDKVTLLGHSLGSVISYLFASTYPELVDRYIAFENLRPIPGLDPTPRFRKTMDKLFEIESKLLQERERPVYSYDEILSRMYKSRDKTVSLEGCKHLLVRGAEKVGKDKYRFSQDLKTNIPTGFRILSDHQTQLMAQNIKCPVCFIKGDPGADYEPREDLMNFYQILEKHAPYAEFHLVKGTHHLHLNSPELVAPIIKRFLNRINY